MDSKIIVALVVVVAAGAFFFFGLEGYDGNGIEIKAIGDDGIEKIDGTGYFSFNTYVDIYAKMKDGYAFEGWYDTDGKKLSEEPVYTIFLQEATTLKARSVEGYNVTVYTTEGVTVKGSGNYGPSENATVKATVEKGYTFTGWYDLDGKKLSSKTSYSLTSAKDTALVAKTDAEQPQGTVNYNVTVDNTRIVTGWDTGYYVCSSTGGSLSAHLEPGLYRIVDYDKDMNPVHTEKYIVSGKAVKTLTWKYSLKTYSVDWTTDYGLYSYYQAFDSGRAPQNDNDMVGFAIDYNGQIKALADALTKKTEGMTAVKAANIVLSFVQQNITYETDEDYCHAIEFWKYPCETLTDGRGDCEDSAMLFCTLMKAMGYDTALLVYTGDEYADMGHAAGSVVLDNVPGGTYYEHDGKKYFYCETTNDTYKVGDSPEGYGTAELVII